MFEWIEDLVYELRRPNERRARCRRFEVELLEDRSMLSVSGFLNEALNGTILGDAIARPSVATVANAVVNPTYTIAEAGASIMGHIAANLPVLPQAVDGSQIPTSNQPSAPVVSVVTESSTPSVADQAPSSPASPMFPMDRGQYSGPIQPFQGTQGATGYAGLYRDSTGQLLQGTGMPGTQVPITNVPPGIGGYYYDAEGTLMMYLGTWGSVKVEDLPKGFGSFYVTNDGRLMQFLDPTRGSVAVPGVQFVQFPASAATGETAAIAEDEPTPFKGTIRKDVVLDDVQFHSDQTMPTSTYSNPQTVPEITPLVFSRPSGSVTISNLEYRKTSTVNHHSTNDLRVPIPLPVPRATDGPNNQPFAQLGPVSFFGPSGQLLFVPIGKDSLSSDLVGFTLASAQVGQQNSPWAIDVGAGILSGSVGFSGISPVSLGVSVGYSLSVKDPPKFFGKLFGISLSFSTDDIVPTTDPFANDPLQGFPFFSRETKQDPNEA